MSLVGFRAKNHPQQATQDAVDDRRTPAALFDEQHAKHRFTLDAAASDINRLLDNHYTLETDGLSQPWKGERVWCNPPYSSIAPWVQKAWNEMEDGCRVVVMLLPANRCEQGWWQKFIEPFRDKAAIHGISLRTRFLPGRMRFAWPCDRVVPLKGDRPPFGCVLLTWENHT